MEPVPINTPAPMLTPEPIPTPDSVLLTNIAGPYEETSVGAAPGVNIDTYHSVFERALVNDEPVEVIDAEHFAPVKVIEQFTFVGGAISAAFAVVWAEKTKTKNVTRILRNRFIL